MTDTIKVTALERLRRDEAKFDAVAVRTRRMKFNIGGGVALLALALIVIAFFSLFTVPQTSQALIVRLGDPVRTISEPGLHMKVPFIDSVIYVDNRILDLESGAEEVIASDQKRLVVEAFARYRIRNPLRFYQTVGTIDGANSRLSPLLNSALRRVLGDFTLTQVLRDDRPALMARVRDRLDTEAQAFGIDVLDVRISRANLPTQNSQAVYQRMQTERQREAAEFRAQGSEKSQEIRARADRDVTVLIADATQGGEQARGDGDVVPGYEATTWWGVGAPKNTPADIIDKLNREINAGLADAKIRAPFADLGGTAIGGSPADFGKLIADETEKWAKVIKFSGAKAD